MRLLTPYFTNEQMGFGRFTQVTSSSPKFPEVGSQEALHKCNPGLPAPRHHPLQPCVRLGSRCRRGSETAAWTGVPSGDRSTGFRGASVWHLLTHSHAGGLATVHAVSTVGQPPNRSCPPAFSPALPLQACRFHSSPAWSGTLDPRGAPLAQGRTASKGRPYPCSSSPLRAGLQPPHQLQRPGCQCLPGVPSCWALGCQGELQADGRAAGLLVAEPGL